MSEEVLLMYGVFILYFIVPLIPAISIYKLFPETKVSASGPLSQLNINTSGAFAAYIIALISGIFIINNTIEIIKQSLAQKKENVDYLWQVKSEFNIIQEDSTKINTETQNQILDGIAVSLQPSPSWFRNSDDGYIVYVPNSLINNNVTISYSAPQCETKTISPNSSNYTKDHEKKEITIGKLDIRRTSKQTISYKQRDTLLPSSSPISN